MKLLSRREVPWPQVLLVAAAVLITAVVGLRIGQSGFDVRYLIAAVLGLAATPLLLANAPAIRIGFLLWISFFAVGYRTLHLTSSFALHPLVALLLALFVLFLVRKATVDRQARPSLLPRVLLVLGPFWLWGWLVGLANGWDWDTMLSDSQSCLLLVPIFVLAGDVIDSPARWRVAVTTFFGVAAVIAAVGLVEYVLPGARQFLPTPVVGTGQLTAAVDFDRAPFLTWGSQTATFICGLAIPFVIPLWVWSPAPIYRLAIACAFSLQLIGIYIGGFRSLWVITAICLAGLLIGLKRWTGVAAAAVGSIVVLILLPASGSARLGSLLAALQGDFQDTSSQDRWQRALAAFQTTLAQPWGAGWTSTGWVHSDFLQVASVLGVLPGLIFLGWYLATQVAILRQWWRQPADRLSLALAGSLFVAGGLLLTEAVIVLPQTAFPVWFVWALVTLKLRVRAGPREAT